MPDDDKRPIRSWNIHLQVKYIYFDVHSLIAVKTKRRKKIFAKYFFFFCKKTNIRVLIIFNYKKT